MLGRSKWLIIIPVMILVPLLLGAAPLNFAHNLANGCVFSPAKQIQKCRPISGHSPNSQDGHLMASQPYSVFNQVFILPYCPAPDSDSAPLLGTSESPPLRC
jgi:hypothetical protein